MLPAKISPHFFFADVLRALAVFAVIILHIASDYVEHYGEISNSDWWAANIYNGLVRFCVPMFVVLSGAFLLRIKYFYRLYRLFPAWILFDQLYIFFRNAYQNLFAWCCRVCNFDHHTIYMLSARICSYRGSDRNRFYT